jgi:hypothetical protein
MRVVLLLSIILVIVCEGRSIDALGVAILLLQAVCMLGIILVDEYNSSLAKGK